MYLIQSVSTLWYFFFCVKNLRNQGGHPISRETVGKFTALQTADVLQLYISLGSVFYFLCWDNTVLMIWLCFGTKSMWLSFFGSKYLALVAQKWLEMSRCLIKISCLLPQTQLENMSCHLAKNIYNVVSHTQMLKCSLKMHLVAWLKTCFLATWCIY